MIALERAVCQPGGEPSIHWVLVFGVGLIGDSLITELSRRGFSGAKRLAFSWQPASGKAREDEADAICGCIKARMDTHVNAGVSTSRISVDIIWSAGQGGFASTWATLDRELSAFLAVIILSTRLLEMLPLAAHRFHLTSSAGGLFEGLLNVGTEAMPAPLRPYGELKLEQEQLLHTHCLAMRKHIYRPSSVYGFVSLNSRLGLITTLINNGMRGQVTNIFAEALTLRDYVLVSDVASFMAQKIEAGAAEADGTYLLASAKPTSVHEVIALLERVLEKPLYYVFRVTHDNTASNTYCPHAVANGFYPQDLETGIRSVLLSMRNHFFRHSP